MSTIGGGNPIDASTLQAAQAQRTASKARDRERADAAPRRSDRDRYELRVTGVESAEAPRALPRNDSEQAEDEHRRHDPRRRKDEPPPRIDLQA